MRVRIEIPDRPPVRREDDRRVGAALAELDESPGRPLPEQLRLEMEARFGADFSDVKIHQDARADSSAEALGARAFTVGTHIFFRAGAFEPGKIDGKRLLAHELAHTLQQRTGSEPRRAHAPLLPAVRTAEEAQARSAADAALTGKRPKPSVREAPHIARWIASLPDDRASNSPVNPFVEELALDVVHALQRDPEDAGAHTRRRLARLEDGTRAAVVARAQELLTPAERERCEKALTGAAVVEDEQRTAAAAPAEQSAPSAQQSAPSADQSAPTAEPAPESDLEQPVPATAREAVAAATAKAADAAKRDAVPKPGAAARPDVVPKPALVARPAGGAPTAKLGAAAKRPAAPAPGAAPAAKAPGAEKPLTEAAAKAAGAGPPEVAKKLGGRSAAEASPAAAAAKTDGGDAGGQPDLGPAAALEEKAEAKGRERQARAEAHAQEIEKKATEQAEHDIQRSPTAAAPAAPAPAEPAAHADAVATLEAVAEADAGGEPETATPAPAAAPVTASPAPLGEPQAGPVPAELEAGAAPRGEADTTAAAEAEPLPEREPGGEGEPTSATEPAETEPAEAAQAETAPAGTAGPAGQPEPAGLAEPGGAAEAPVAAGVPTAPALELSAAPEPATTPEPAAAPEPAASPEPAAAAEPLASEASSAVRDEAPAGEPATATAAPEAAPAEAPGPDSAETAATAGAEAPAAEGGETPGTDGAAAEPAAADAAGTQDSEAGGADAGAGDAPAGDGGDCGPDSAPGVGGGGGGGAAIPDPQPEPEPDVSQSSPEDAMATAATLAPGPLVRTLGGVKSASQREVAGKRDDLAANPPSIERPTGSPQTRDGRESPGAGAPVLAGSAGPARAHADRSPHHAPAPKQVPPPLPPAPPSPLAAVRPPAVNKATQAPMTPQEVQAWFTAIGLLPVTDPGLDLTAGPAPTVPTTGDFDAGQATETRANRDQAVGAAAREGAEAAAAPLGEHNIYPAVRPEILRAEPSAGKSSSKPTTAAGAPTAGAAPAAAVPPAMTVAPATAPAAPGSAGATAAPGAAPPGAAPGAAATPAGLDPAEVIAKEQSTADVQAAAAQGKDQMVAGREEQDSRTDKANADAQAQIDKDIADNSKAQEDQRKQTLAQVGKQRGDWTGEQKKAVDKHSADEDDQMRRVDTEVTGPREQANKDAAASIQEGNDKAAKARRDGEAKAAAARREGEQKSRSGVIGWLEDKAEAAFDWVKDRIKDAFDWARKLVHDAITWAINKANEIIDRVRNAIVGALNSIRDALLKLGDALLGWFPALHDRYRKAINGLVDAAVKKVDELADGLKAAVKKALTALMDAIDAVLAFYEKALLAAVSFVERAAMAALDKARAFVEMLKQWGQLITDVASGPLQWLSNLGSSAIDGFKNHLWREFKCAVKAWFRSKVEEVLGLPLTLFELLKKGGIKFAEIAHMVWEGLKAAIPGILIQLAIEKIVAMIVPAAGAIMAIIEGLQAAWGTIQRIIAAFEKFMAFLLAVKAGNAGRKFAQMIAAAAVVVLDFLANFLIKRLMKPAKPIGGRLAAIGKKIMARLGNVARAVGRGLRRAGQIIKTGVKKAAAAVRKAAVVLKQAAQKAGRAIAKVAGRVGRAIKRGAGKVVAAVRKGAGRAMRAIERRFPSVARVLRKGAALVRRVGRGFRRVGRAIRRKWRRAKAWVRKKRAQFRRWREERRRRAMERAQRELPPKIHGLLQRGWPEPAMWLALQGWKLLYGLRVLRLRTSGAEAEIEAANSPPSVLVSGIVMGWRVDIATRIRELEDEVIDDPEVKRVAAHIMDQRRRGFGSEERPIEIVPSPGGLGAARDLRLLAQLEGRVPGQGRVAGGLRLSFGSRLGAGSIKEAEHFRLAPGLPITREAAYRTLHPGSILVGGAGRYATGVLADIPEDERAVMAAVRDVQRGGAPTGLVGAESMQRVAELGRLEQVEMARGGIFSESVGTELASEVPAPGAKPLLSFEERYGAAQPMTRKDAGRISRAARGRLGLEPIPGLGRGSASEEEVEAFLRDEMALVSRFVELQVYAQRELYDNEEAIRRYIKRHLIDHLRLVLTAMAATGSRPGSGK